MVLERRVNVYMFLRISFLGGNLSFISLKQGTVIERHQSGRCICATNMGDKCKNIFYHTFLHYINNFLMQKRNGVSLLLLGECFRHFLYSREIWDDRIIEGGRKEWGLDSQLITGLELFIRCLRLASKQKNH